MSTHFYSYRRKYRCVHRLQMGKINIFLGNMEAQTETVQLTYILMNILVGMGLASIRPNDRDSLQEQYSGEADGGKPHPY